MVRLLFPCDWCKEVMAEGYMRFWRVVNGVKVDETYLHFECEEDFMGNTDKKHWFEEYCEPMPEIYINPHIAKWRRKKDAEENSDDVLR